MILEGLHLLGGPNGESLPEIMALPKEVSTMLARLRNRIPLCHMRQTDIPVRNVKQPTVAGSSRRDQLVATLRQELASKDTKVQRVRKRPAGMQTKRKANDLGEVHAKRQAIAVVDTLMRSSAGSGAKTVPHLSGDQSGAQMTNVKLQFFDTPTIFKNLFQSTFARKTKTWLGQ